MPGRQVSSRIRLFSTMAVLLMLAGACSGSSDEPGSRSPAPAPSPSPVTANALLQGSWDVTVTTLKSTYPQGDKPGTKGKRVWDITPTCTDGPCDVDISRTTKSKERVENHAVFEDGVYRFGETARQPCLDEQNRPVPSQISTTTVTVEFHVTEAELQDGILVATRFEGTYTSITTVPKKVDCEPKRAEETARYVGVAA